MYVKKEKVHVCKKGKCEDSYISNTCPYLQPITFHCQSSMYALIILMRLMLWIKYPPQKNLSHSCQCKVHHINAKCTTSMQSAPCLSTHNQFDLLHDDVDSVFLSDNDEDFVMEKV